MILGAVFLFTPYILKSLCEVSLHLLLWEAIHTDTWPQFNLLVLGPQLYFVFFEIIYTIH